MSAPATILAQVAASVSDSLTNIMSDSIDAVNTMTSLGIQVADSSGNMDNLDNPAIKDLSVWELCMEGGWVMIPLALLAIVAIYIFFERSIMIKRAAYEDTTFMQRIKDYIHEGEIESARNLCFKTDTPYARLIDKGISRIGRQMNDVLVAIESQSGQRIDLAGNYRCRCSDDRFPRHGYGNGKGVLQSGKCRFQC